MYVDEYKRIVFILTCHEEATRCYYLIDATINTSLFFVPLPFCYLCPLSTIPYISRILKREIVLTKFGAILLSSTFTLNLHKCIKFIKELYVGSYLLATLRHSIYLKALLTLRYIFTILATSNKLIIHKYFIPYFYRQTFIKIKFMIHYSSLVTFLVKNIIHLLQ